MQQQAPFSSPASPAPSSRRSTAPGAPLRPITNRQRRREPTTKGRNLHAALEHAGTPRAAVPAPRGVPPAHVPPLLARITASTDGLTLSFDLL